MTVTTRSEYEEVLAVHPHWEGHLLLSRTDNKLVHKEAKSTGTYDRDQDILSVHWDKFAPERFVLKGDVFVQESMLDAYLNEVMKGLPLVSKFTGQSPMRRPKVFGIGFSHLAAVFHAQNHRVHYARHTFDMTVLTPEQDERFRPFESLVDGRPKFHEDFQPYLAEQIANQEPDFVFGSLWGNQNFVLSTTKNLRSFDFILPNEPACERIADAQLIPFEMMKALITVYFQKVDFLLQGLKSLTKAPIILAPAPPPMEEFSAISDPRLNAQVEQFGIADPVLRYKFWKLCEEIYQEKAVAHGVTLLPVPPESHAAEGFRRPEYFGPDWLHANVAYGELVLKQLDQIIGGTRQSEVA